MDFCGHLMKQCHEIEEFILPEPVSKIEPAKSAPLVFSKDENEVNLTRCQKKRFYDQQICRHLCSETRVLKSTRTSSISPCESICFELTRSFDSAGDVCPFQKYCQNGCPCPFYECEKFDSRQKLIPVFGLRKLEEKPASATSENNHWVTNGDIELITGRWIGRQIEKESFPILLADFNFQIEAKNTYSSDFLFPYERFCFRYVKNTVNTAGLGWS